MARLVEEFKLLGYDKLLVKSDNAPVIVAIFNEALRCFRIDGMVQVLREGLPA